jgi:hypothetical protein
MEPLGALGPLASEGAVDPFWVVVVYAFVFGMFALVAWVFYYWIVVIPKKVLPPQTSRPLPVRSEAVRASRAQNPRVFEKAR